MHKRGFFSPRTTPRIFGASRWCKFFGFNTKFSVSYYKPIFMKLTLLLGCALLTGSALHAQLSLLPYVGYEQSHAKVNYNNGLSAKDINGFLKAGLRADYRLKGGHSPFVNLTSNPAPATFAFDKTGSLVNQVQASALQFRMEAGYQYSSKPIRLGKGSAPKSSQATASSATKEGCGSIIFRSCGSKKQAAKTAPPSQSLNMRLQPSVAVAYIPASVQGVTQTTSGFDYTPSWKTAVVPAMNVEFAKGTQRLFTLGVFYTQPFGQDDEAISTMVENKSLTTNLQPQMSSWGLTLGIPFSFAKSNQPKDVKSPTETKKYTEKKSCTRTYYRCMRPQ